MKLSKLHVWKGSSSNTIIDKLSSYLMREATVSHTVAGNLTEISCTQLPHLQQKQALTNKP